MKAEIRWQDEDTSHQSLKLRYCVVKVHKRNYIANITSATFNTQSGTVNSLRMRLSVSTEIQTVSQILQLLLNSVKINTIRWLIRNGNHQLKNSGQRKKMNKPRVFADFHNADVKGRLRLSCDGIVLRDGQPLIIYSEELEVEGIVNYSEEEKLWTAAIDWNAIREVG